MIFESEGSLSSQKSWARIERAARRVHRGSELLAFLSQPKRRKALIERALIGEPSVSAVSQELVRLLGPKDAKSILIKQFIGRCVSAILEEEGFAVDRSGVWLNDDPMFSTGTVYRKLAEAPHSRSSDLLERLVDVLSQEELDRLYDLIKRRRR